MAFQLPTNDPKIVEPKTFLIGHTEMSKVDLAQYLRETNNQEFLKSRWPLMLYGHKAETVDGLVEYTNLQI